VTLSRREALLLTATALAPAQDKPHMYGLIGQIKAVPGKRDDLAAILVDASAGMPGCLSYIVAKDPADADAVWVTEVWETEAAHQASLAIPAVKQAIAKGRPLIAGFAERHTTEPVGGYGLPPARK
jgi:quinol monooxygenase YgiN